MRPFTLTTDMTENVASRYNNNPAIAAFLAAGPTVSITPGDALIADATCFVAICDVSRNAKNPAAATMANVRITPVDPLNMLPITHVSHRNDLLCCC